MAKISEVKNSMGDGGEITIKGKPQEELIAIKEVLIGYLNNYVEWR